MTTKTKRAPKVVQHPGSACCDLTQDLAGWVARENARIERMWRWNRVLRQRGNRLRATAIKAIARGNPIARDLEGEALADFGTANAIGQSAMIRAGHLERVIEAHQYRLTAVSS